MECFRIDESGYTGYDLLNPDQRFQGATAIAISNEDATRLIKEYFPKLHVTELKYRNLSRRSANHPQLLGLQRDLLRDYKCVTYVCDKRFLLVLMFLDYAVEPYYYERGFNFYENGQNYALASLLYSAGPTILGKEEFDALLAAFQRAVKQKTPGSLRDLVLAARKTGWRELPEALGPLAQYAAPECLDAIATPGVNTDAALVVLQSLISRMEVMADGPYRVEHDQSKNLLSYHELLQRLIDHDEVAEFRQSAIASLKFPLQLTEVNQVNSRSSPAVQLADVMIGAAIEAANNLTGLRTGGLDPAALISLYREGQFIHLLPSLDFEEQRRFRQGTQAAEVIDYFTNNVFGPARGKRGGEVG
ncbi:MAG: hypothetical protein EOR26_25710 [Mesorhizobium sp.]|uniref:DUF3800 domain-containing protein n=1 Tax=unclassified Mesorhizobium TaxID=325217 RepID=UPI000FCCA98B|nr:MULTISPECIES: DUF3800 domain-containing protein [unclassified Mesorhizobium]RUV71553.1 hypothetical protein EOA78_17295 [Mesorhizobium sp. M5C.F.Cr.IN.023.01.1.1]RWI46653.1 MAG: hypothetical protein EOR15_17620 [Mesorhizobium sp.]RWI56167.1 MAG: hypothetical protein EOR16_19360 [Mesorhizobium sp.]RWJ08861.1 MAG: hypothetical protein EOR24_20475 [Mesorhizobium sp.]RWJ15990.1 MAG: hypothetical protein EOR25_18375 [Mesorhizobium sp.]